jgi:hypothetical protein
VIKAEPQACSTVTHSLLIAQNKQRIRARSQPCRQQRRGENDDKQ